MSNTPLPTHTPTPWRLGPKHKDGTIAIHAGRASIFHLTPFSSSAATAEANAAFIEKAVNNHDDLVEALQELADAVDEEQTSDPDMTSHTDTVYRLERAVEGARAVLLSCP